MKKFFSFRYVFCLTPPPPVSLLSFFNIPPPLPPKQVTNGKGAMPAWGGQLSPEEINAVASYVFDQASGDKW